MESFRPFRVALALLLVLVWLTPIADAAVPRCFGARATRVGTNRGDTIRGTARKDVIVAKGGADKIKGLGRNDLICAGGGNDTVDAGPGADKVDGGSGQDKLYGTGGNDVLRGGTGVDLLNGGSGADTCSAAESIVSCEQPAYATSIQMTGPDPLVAPIDSAAAITAAVRDQNGNLMPGATVTFTTAGTASPVPVGATVTSGGGGIAVFSPTSDAPGTTTASACVTRVGGSKACDTKTVEWEVREYAVTVSAPCYPAREGDVGSYPVTVRVVDQFGTPSPTDVTVGIASGDSNVMTGEATAVVPAGESSGQWLGTGVSAGQTSITATLGTSTDSVPASVQPAAGATVTSITLTRQTASPVAGQPALVVAAPLTDYGPASEPGGTVIDLEYSTGASGPDQQIVLENTCTVGFEVTADVAGTHTVTACVGQDVCSEPLQVTFGPPPQ